MRRGKTVIDLAAERVAQARLGDRQQRPGVGIIRIDLHGPAADAHDALFAPQIAVIAGDPILPRHQIEVVGLGVVRAALLDRLLLFRQQLELQRRDDRLRDLVLHGEDVGEVAVVALGPDVAAACAVDQLGGDPHPVPGLAHAAFQHVADAELRARPRRRRRTGP